jgi:hypothetical protein
MEPLKLRFFLQGEPETAVIGVISSKDNRHFFRPVVPFSEGQTYEVRLKGRKLTSFTLTKSTAALQPRLTAIYPTRDTVPENLLKLYLQFSQPMQGIGQALNFINVVDKTTGEEVEVFLDLESELWNKEHDRLTLWLDPGRIKTDLIPNQELGPPLKAGHEYIIHISEKWVSAKGVPLNKPAIKILYVAEQDREKPDISHWKIDPPAAKSKSPLHLRFGEAMDAILALETIAVIDPNGAVIKGDFELVNKETELLFIPLSNWNKGIYNIQTDPKLEDLAGNNMTRLFDKNLQEEVEKTMAKTAYSASFIVQ